MVAEVERLFGKDLVPLFRKFGSYEAGEPFTFYVDIDVVCDEPTSPEVAKAEQKGLDEMVRRLTPMREVFAELRDSLYDTGILFKDPVRGVGIKMGKEMTEDQMKLYENVNSLIDKIDTFIKVY